MSSGAARARVGSVSPAKRERNEWRCIKDCVHLGQKLGVTRGCRIAECNAVQKLNVERMDALADAIAGASAMADDRRRIEQSRTFVRAELSIETMAQRLADIYGALAPASSNVG